MGATTVTHMLMDTIHMPSIMLPKLPLLQRPVLLDTQLAPLLLHEAHKDFEESDLLSHGVTDILMDSTDTHTLMDQALLDTQERHLLCRQKPTRSRQVNYPTEVRKTPKIHQMQIVILFLFYCLIVCNRNLFVCKVCSNHSTSFCS